MNGCWAREKDATSAFHWFDNDSATGAGRTSIDSVFIIEDAFEPEKPGAHENHCDECRAKLIKRGERCTMDCFGARHA